MIIFFFSLETYFCYICFKQILYFKNKSSLCKANINKGFRAGHCSGSNWIDRNSIVSFKSGCVRWFWNFFLVGVNKMWLLIYPVYLNKDSSNNYNMSS